MPSTDWPPPPEAIEYERCRRSPERFVRRHCHLYDAASERWLPFDLWPAQAEDLATLHAERLVCLLKARQLGASWVVVSYVLWYLLFRPGSTAILFSKRDDEAVDLLDFRLKGMYDRLPDWMRAARKGAAHDWALPNGSRAMAFPTTGGRSYTASLAVVDEADYVPDLNALLNAVEPTISAGGKLLLLSTADKSVPDSTFKRIYLAAKRGENGYRPLFRPWSARPDRTPEWYAAEKARLFSRTGADDDLHQEYPATDIEALAPRSLDKRLPLVWLTACFVERGALDAPPRAPTIPGLRLYVPPRPSARFVVGGDPAEGNPTSDPSACCLLDADTGEECASFAGRHEVTVFAGYLADLARFFNRASLMVERNNHGHAVLAWLRDNAPDLPLLYGHDGKPGWMSSSKGKALLYGHAADAFRAGGVLLHTLSAQLQLASVEGGTLRAPVGMHDDEADACALALAGMATRPLPFTGTAAVPRAAVPISTAPPVLPPFATGGRPRP